jgi:hypothetical protein
MPTSGQHGRTAANKPGCQRARRRRCTCPLSPQRRGIPTLLVACLRRIRRTVPGVFARRVEPITPSHRASLVGAVLDLPEVQISARLGVDALLGRLNSSSTGSAVAYIQKGLKLMVGQDWTGTERADSKVLKAVLVTPSKETERAEGLAFDVEKGADLPGVPVGHQVPRTLAPTTQSRWYARRAEALGWPFPATRTGR